MSLTKLASKNLKPATANEVAVPATPVDADVNQALSLLPETPGVTMADTLNAALSTESARAISPFALINLTGGPSGGMFAPADFLPQEVQDTLPSGKRPLVGVLMGYRMAVSAWASGYIDAPADADKSKARSKPVYSCSVSANDAKAMPLAMKAGRNYQFTKAADKAKFDYATSRAGHIRLAIELMVYLPEVGQPVIVSTPSNYGAVETTLQNIAKLIDAKTGGLGQFPCNVRAVTVDKSSKSGFTWKEHSLDMVNSAGSQDGAASWNSYGAWKAEAMKDAGTVQAVRDWINAQDRAVTSEVTAALMSAASL